MDCNRVENEDYQYAHAWRQSHQDINLSGWDFGGDVNPAQEGGIDAFGEKEKAKERKSGQALQNLSMATATTAVSMGTERGSVRCLTARWLQGGPHSSRVVKDGRAARRRVVEDRPWR